MRPRKSLLSVVVVLGLLGTAVTVVSWRSSVATAGPVTLEEAVRRTRAAGSARLAATVRPAGGGSEVAVEGVTSLVSPEARVVATLPGAGAAEVRVTAAGEAWLRTREDGPWVAVDAATLHVAGSSRGWGDLLGGLEAAGPPLRSGPVRAAHEGAPAQVWLDPAGRIRRLVVHTASGTLDVRLSDLGLRVEVRPPR